MVSSEHTEEYMSEFFYAISKNRTDEFLVLNFNYTKTFEKLYKSLFGKCDIINIHGELHNKSNPIVFGYAPTDQETMNLINQNNNELLKNIKRYYYKRTDSELRLNKFIESQVGDFPSKIHVHILGHSCGVSDRNILKNIFVNENVDEISIMYYNDYDNYFNVLVNIDRVVENNKQYGIINNFNNCVRMPQHDDNEISIKKTNKMITDIFPDTRKVLLSANRRL